MKDTLDLLFLDLNPSLETSDSFLLLPFSQYKGETKMFSSLAIQEEDLRERFNHAKTLNNLADCASAILEFVDYVQAVSPVFASCYEEWRGEPNELQYQKPVFTVGEAAEILAIVKGEGFSRLVTPYYNRKIFSGLNEAKQISFDGSMAVFEMKEKEGKRK